jgi:hypothetical protein
MWDKALELRVYFRTVAAGTPSSGVRVLFSGVLSVPLALTIEKKSWNREFQPSFNILYTFRATFS